jgi:FtsP/CotA-like multicopper oxidase with cupredoxin domain
MHARLILCSLACVASASATEGVEEIITNQNRVPAGRIAERTLHIELEARAGMWYPETKDGPGLAVQAFGEPGRRLSVPGPLIRVPEGTQIRATVRNRLADRLTLRGFHTRPIDTGAMVEVAPGEVREVTFNAGVAGTYYYWGSTTIGGPITGRPLYKDAVLSGAFIVDPRGAKPDPEERVFMIALWRLDPALDDRSRITAGQSQRRTMAINGLSWPYTERLTYGKGQTVRWRWINPSFEPHPMHLHGFYYDVLSLGDAERDTVFAEALRPRVVTQRIPVGGTMSMAWTPDRIGNWLFHCHMLDHIGPHNRLQPIAAQRDAHAQGGGGHALEGMTGLVMGIRVRAAGDSAAPAAAAQHREIRLFIQEQPNRFGDQPALGYALQQGDQEPAPGVVTIPGPTIFLTRGEPTSIIVTNRTREETSVHWHGMELESYFDGVPGWGGDDRRITPPITPGNAFVAEMTPRRAGTFIYHTHWHDARQLNSGMYGPLIVLEPGQHYDTAIERVVLISAVPHAPTASAPILMNGSLKPEPMQLQVGKTHRFRLINITDNNVGFVAHLVTRGGDYVEWRAVAKDGADLPPSQAVVTKSMESLAVGETRDFEYRPMIAGEMRFEVRTSTGVVRAVMDVQVR